MSPDITSLLYLVAAVLFILALRGLSSPVTSRRGNQFGMIGMAIAVLATLGRPGMRGNGYVLIVLGIAIGGGAGAVTCAAHPDDGAAATGRRVPLAGGPGRGVRGRRRAECARGLRHRRAASHPHRKPDRDVDRPGHRRHHLHRLADRVRQAAGADEGHADHLPLPAPAQPGAGAAAPGADRLFRDAAACRRSSG